MTPEAQLLYAAWCGDAARVGELLSVGVAVDVRDGKGRTPLMLAAGNNAVEAIRPLLAAGADPSARNNGNRPVIDYVRCVEVARLVLAHMPPEQRVAAATRLLFSNPWNPELLQFALDSGARVNARNKRGDTPLMMHCWSQVTDGMRILLAAGAEPDVSNCHQDSPLSRAIYLDKLEHVELLLAAGIDANACLKGRGERPLHIVCSAQMAFVLLAAGADVNATDADGRTPLMNASGHDLELVRTLLQAGAEVNACNEEGSVLAHFSGMSDEVAELLYAAGARYNVKLPGDMAAAVHNSYTIWLKELIVAGGDIHHPVEDNRTPLQLAAWSGERGEQALQILLSAGAAATLDYRDAEEGVTALHAAVIACRETWNASVDNVVALLAAGADANLADRDGWTPLHSCACYQLPELVPLLLKYGANAEQRDYDGNTPAELALSLNHIEMAELLQNIK